MSFVVTGCAVYRSYKVLLNGQVLVVGTDLDGKSYSRRIKLNLLKKNEYRELEGNVFNYRYDFYKRDLQLRKIARKRKKLLDPQNIDQKELPISF